jgi:hypothetical protein
MNLPMIRQMPKKQKKKRLVTITRDEAVRRVNAMTELLAQDVKSALWIRAAMEAANDEVVRFPDRHYDGAETYNAVAQSLMIALAVSACRLFDQGIRHRHPNKRDVASIPLLLRLLRQKRCRDYFIEKARHWTPHLDGTEELNARSCETAIDEAMQSYNSLVSSHLGRNAVERLKAMRDHRIAHSLMKASPHALPRYSELFRAVDNARDVVSNVLLAVQGISYDLKDFEEVHRTDADTFWKAALAGATREP